MIVFERCWDDERDDEPEDASFSTDGHHEPSRGLLLALGRAIAYEMGYDHEEAADLLATARFYTGYVGTHPTQYDYYPCYPDGVCINDCDEDGNEIVLTDVKPTTWGSVNLEAPPRKGGKKVYLSD